MDGRERQAVVNSNKAYNNMNPIHLKQSIHTQCMHIFFHQREKHGAHGLKLTVKSYSFIFNMPYNPLNRTVANTVCMVVGFKPYTAFHNTIVVTFQANFDNDQNKRAMMALYRSTG